MRQARKSTTGNHKLEYLAGHCKATATIVNETEFEYDSECIQTFLKILVKTGIELLTRESKAELGIM